MRCKCSSGRRKCLARLPPSLCRLSLDDVYVRLTLLHSIHACLYVRQALLMYECAYAYMTEAHCAMQYFALRVFYVNVREGLSGFDDAAYFLRSLTRSCDHKPSLPWHPR